MLIRRNPCYRTRFQRDHRGYLLVTKRWIIATGTFAACWS